jgi:tRNA threonylcarbamoyladenosine biosynthesis protein TsaB
MLKMTRYILAMDTTMDPGSIALAEGAQLIEETVLRAPDGYGDILFIEIERLLERHSVTLRDIECFAAASGPGTFTGVRAGLTAAKGFAHAAGRTVVGVSNLQATAWFGAGDLRAPYRDAHRGEIYGAIFDAQLRTVQDEVVTKYDAWIAGLPEGALPMTQQQPLARAIAAIAWERMQAGLAQDPAELDANYVRRADAELMWRDV